MSAQDLLRQAAALGVELVQIVDNLPLDQLTVAALNDLHDLAEDHSIELQIGTRGVERSHLLEYLDIARRLDAKLVRTMGGWHGNPASLAEIEKNVTAVLPDFVEANVSLALENYEAYSTHDLANLVSSINHPKVGICLDLTNSFGALESAQQILANLAPLTINLHLKEFIIKRLDYLMGFAFLGRPTGKGKLPLAQIFGRLAACHRQPDIIVELWTPFTRTLEETLALEKAWASESIDFLRAYAADVSPAPTT
jgi:3-oxoisoapionate decarboxylase